MSKVATFNKEFEKYQSKHRSSFVQDVEIKGNSVLFKDSGRIYSPFPTIERFHNSDKKVKLIMGPFGSGKTSGCWNEIVMHSCKMPKTKAGIRISRWAIIRCTYGRLLSTTLKTWLNWCPTLGVCHKSGNPVMTRTYTFNDGNGPVEMEFMFLSIERPVDLEKLRSLEITGAYLNELSELPDLIIPVLLGRCRYPDPSFFEKSEIEKTPLKKVIIADTNPPNTNHWIYKQFIEKNSEQSVSEDISNYELFRQPPGLIKVNGDYEQNDNMENKESLMMSNPNYYLDMAEGQDEEFIKVFCLGEFGMLRCGKVVYPQYNDDLHSGNVLGNKKFPLIIGMDFGITPAVVIVQITDEGQLCVLEEITTDRIDIPAFVADILIPKLNTQYSGYYLEMICGDPSSKAASEWSIVGPSSVLSDNNLPFCYASTNAINPRLGFVKHFLNRLINGKSAFRLDRIKAPVLRGGFQNDYIYKSFFKLGGLKEAMHDIPEKLHPISDVQDALQYACSYILNKREKIPESKSSSPVIQWHYSNSNNGGNPSGNFNKFR